MKSAIIGIVKKNKFLYNLAKKVNRKLGNIPPKKEYKTSNKIYFTYILENTNDIDKIKEHYDSIKNEKSILLIVIDDIAISKNIHKLMRQYDDILFSDANYFKNYNKNFPFEKIVLIDYKSKPSSFLKYIG